MNELLLTITVEEEIFADDLVNQALEAYVKPGQVDSWEVEEISVEETKD